MAKLKSPRLFVVIVACILSDYVIKIHAHICEVGRERNQYNEWKWVLPYPNPCECTKIIIGGMNTRTTIYPFDPVYVDSPLLLDNVGAIRQHYGLRCSTEKSNLISTGTTINSVTIIEDATSTHASTAAETAFKSSTNDEDTTNAPAPTTTATSATIKSSTKYEDTTSAAASASTEVGASITSSANNEDTTSTPVSTSTNAETACTMKYSNNNEDTTSDAASGAATINSSPRSQDTTSGISTSAATIITQGCCGYLGMEKHHIPDQNINASGYRHDYYPQNGRLNAANTWWAAAMSEPWIQADIGYQTYVSGVITQGGGTTFCCWVKKLKVSTFESNTNNLEIFVKDEDGSLKIYGGNSDENSLKESIFPYPVYARVVRITCLARHKQQWMMRFEILGCKLQ